MMAYYSLAFTVGKKCTWTQGRNYRGCSRCGTWARGVSGPKDLNALPDGPPLFNYTDRSRPTGSISASRQFFSDMFMFKYALFITRR